MSQSLVIESEMSIVDLSLFAEPLKAGQILLTPGLRLARHIRQSWIQDQLARFPDAVTAVSEPRIYPIDAWLEQQWCAQIEAGALPVARLLSRLEERLLWQSVIESDAGFTDDFTLLQPAAAAERAMQSRQQLMNYAEHPHILFSRGEFDLDPDCAAFKRWNRAFEQRLNAHGWLTRGDAYHQLFSLPEAQVPVTLCFGGLLPPLTRRALSHLAEVTEVGAVSPDQASLLPAKGYPDRSTELAAAAHWAAQRHRQGLGSTAIVLLDIKRDRPELEYHLRDAFDCLDTYYTKLPVNFSAGMPLGDTPLFRDALLGLKVGAQTLDRSEVLALLRSPYLLPDGFLQSAEGLQLSRALTDLGMEQIDVADLAHLCADLIPDSKLAAIARDKPDTHSRRTVDFWVEVFRGRLATWYWPARKSLDSLEYQQLDKLEQSFDQMLALTELAGEVTYDRALALWHTVLIDIVFQPKTEQTAVHVLGPMEILGLHFDAVWICGANAGVLPAKAQLLPFIPAGIQAKLGIPSSDERVLKQQARWQVASWQSTHARVEASFHHLVDGVEQLPSQMLALNDDSPPVPPRWSRWRDPVALESVDDSLAVLTSTDAVPDVMAEIPFGGGTGVIKSQASCPFRAWVSHRIGPRSVSQPVFGLTPIERGEIAHAALDIFWRPLNNQAELLALDAASTRNKVDAAVAAAIREVERSMSSRGQPLRKRVGSACLDLEQVRMVALILEWLELERAREQPFELLEAEQRHRLQVGPLTLNLRPDRVDQLMDGRQVVIDYKTGGVSRSRWLGERPADPQLPIYALLDGGVEGVAFACLKRNDKGRLNFVWIGEQLGLNPGGRAKDDLGSQLRNLGAEAKDWAALRDVWRSRITALAEEYVRGVAAIDPQPQACLYCDLASVCRINSDQIEALVEGEDTEGFGQ